MIVEKRINIKISNKTFKYYQDKNYNTKNGELLSVLISDLQLGSHTKITVKCDKCGTEKKYSYKDYMKLTNNNTKNYYCNKCKSFKMKKTKLEKYNDENYNNTSKRLETNLEKYGVKHILQSTFFKENFKQTNLEKYGVEYPIQLDIFKEKQQQTNLKEYGFKYSSLNKKIREKQSLTKAENFSKKIGVKLLDYDFDTNNYTLECVYGHTYTENSNLLYSRWKSNTTLCTTCNPKGVNHSDKENNLLKFIKKIYEQEIITSDRKILDGKELDIYLPDLNLAFEFNGIYWHNELHKDKNYHLDKTNKCLEKNIHLVHIYEDDWNYKQDIIKSMILNKLGKNENRIYARKTEIKDLSDKKYNKLIRIFLDENHLQGFVGSKVKLGLFYNDNLVSLMTFGQKRLFMKSKSKTDNEYELLRYCNVLNTNVIGGASKLFKYFVKNYDIVSITTFADRSHSQGNLYETLGFKFIHKTQPNYFYVINKKRKHRFGFRKNVLVEQGYDKEMTEHEIMLSRNIYRIFDSGSLKYAYSISI